MIVKLISQKSFLVKIGVLLILLVLGKGLREDTQVLTADSQVIKGQEVKPPLVISTSNSTSVFPTAGLTSSMN